MAVFLIVGMDIKILMKNVMTETEKILTDVMTSVKLSKDHYVLIFRLPAIRYVEMDESRPLKHAMME